MFDSTSLKTGFGWGDAYKAHAAGTHSFEPDFLWDQRPHPFLEEVSFVHKLRDKRAEIVMDAGCGDGRNSLFLAQCGFSVLGVDISREGVEIARVRAISAGHTNLMFAVDDICDMRTIGPVDAILCADALGQVSDPKKAIEEFFKILRPGGILVANVYDKEDDTYAVGKPHPEINEAFIYKNTLFRFFDQEGYRAMFSDNWGNVEIRKSIWFDPPHGEFRPIPHKHSSLVAWAEKPRGDE